MSEIQFPSVPPYAEYWAHSTYLPNCWYQTRVSANLWYTKTRTDTYHQLREVSYASLPWRAEYFSGDELWNPSRIKSIEEKYGDFRTHVLPYTSTNAGLDGFKERGFSFSNENDSYMAELLTHNKNVRIVNSSNLDRLNGALTTKSEIDLGKMYATQIQDAVGKTNYLEYRDVKELTRSCHIDATTHVRNLREVEHSTDPNYPLGYDSLNGGEASKIGSILGDPGDYWTLRQQTGGGGISFFDPTVPPSSWHPIPYGWDYTRNLSTSYAWYSRFAYQPWQPVRSAKVLNGKEAFIFGDDLYLLNERGREKTGFLSFMLVAKPTSIDTGKIFASVGNGGRFLVHLPWETSGAGYFDWTIFGTGKKNRLTFDVDMVNPAVYTFTASKGGIAHVRVNGVTVASTNNAAPWTAYSPFTMNGAYSGWGGHRWWNPAMLGELLITSNKLLFDNWLPYERFLMKKWRIPHE